MWKDFKKYHISVFTDAWRNTVNYFGFDMSSLIKTLLLWVTSILITIRIYPAQIEGAWDAAIVAVSSAVLAFAILFSLNLLMSPSRLDAEKNKKIEAMEGIIAKRMNYKIMYETLLGAHKKGEDIAHSGLSPIDKIEEWKAETIQTMKGLNVSIADIRSFENPWGIETGRHLENLSIHLGYLDSYIKKFMAKSED